MADERILLLRHGIAEPRGEGLQDASRSLTPEGRERTRRVCQRALRLGLQASTLVTSPLLRARQTAEIAVEEGLAPTLACSDALAPGADPWPLLQLWLEQAQQRPPCRLLLVGHEPDLGDLACRLMQAPPGAVALKKAGLAVLGWPAASPSGLPPSGAQLHLLLTPRILLGS